MPMVNLYRLTYLFSLIITDSEVSILKLLFQHLTDSYALLENPVDNYIMGVVGGIVFLVAYNIVGWLYDENLITRKRK